MCVWISLLIVELKFGLTETIQIYCILVIPVENWVGGQWGWHIGNSWKTELKFIIIIIIIIIIMIILLIRIGFVDDLAWDLPEGYGRNGEDVEGEMEKKKVVE